MDKEELRKEILEHFNSLLKKRQELLSKGWENFTETVKKALDDFNLHIKVDLSPEVPENIEPIINIIPLAGGEAVKPSNTVYLIAGVRSMREEVSQSRLITHLLEAVSRLTNRVLLFVVKENNLIGWDGRGFENMEELDFRRIVIPVSSKTTLGKVIESHEIYIGEFPKEIGDDKVMLALGGQRPSQVLILPIVVKGKPVGLVYCDELPDESTIRNPEEIEILVSYAEAMVELLPVRSKYLKEKKEKKAAKYVVAEEKKTETSTRVGEDTARRMPTLEEEIKTTPDEELEVVAEEKAPEIVEVEEEEKVSRTETGEIPAMTEEERKLHEVARRKAKVLVSDIMLYNAEKIEEGKRKGNIYNELKDEIKLAIEIYKRKVDPRVKIDYLYKELLDKLAGGDPTLLQGYPGV